MPRLAPVFDTNIYRGGFDVEILRELEAQCDVQPLATFYTFLELGAHLGDPNDPDFRIAEKALTRLHDHTIRNGAGQPFVPFIADVEGDLARGLFRKRLPGRDCEADLYGETLGVITRQQSGCWDQRTQQVLATIRRRRDRVESQFTDDMRQAVKAIDPNAPGWQPFPDDAAERKRWIARLRNLEDFPFTAEALVRRTAAQLEIMPSNDEISSRRDWIISTFPAALHFYNGLVCKCIESGVDFSAPKHVNSIWDLQLMFLAACDAQSGGVPIVLVTNEKSLAAAAGAARVSERVWDFAKYQERLSAVAGGAAGGLGSPAL